MELWALTTIVKKKETRAKNIPEMILYLQTVKDSR